MTTNLNAQVPADGSVALDWHTAVPAASVALLIVRTGAVPAFTAFGLSGRVERYRIDHLSRHQRYRLAVAAMHADGVECSPWVCVTPSRGVTPVVEAESNDLASHLAGIARVTVMPQDRRLTVYWQRTPGFCDSIVLELFAGDRLHKRISLEPEVTSLVLDRSRGARLKNGEVYRVAVQARFAGLAGAAPPAFLCTPAPQGEERQANRGFAQEYLVYPTLVLSPEVAVFGDEPQAALGTDARDEPLLCCYCRTAVRWLGYRLVCGGCGAEFIQNGRGDFLDAARLRFGVCRCCLPTKILIQKAGTDALVCAHSGKEYIRQGGNSGFHLIEDLPFGLCQCCRPRRPLMRKGESVRCQKTDERHHNQNGRWVLLPSEPVFDAAAIDDLLDQGLADICATGVSRGTPNRRKS